MKNDCRVSGTKGATVNSLTTPCWNELIRLTSFGPSAPGGTRSPRLKPGPSWRCGNQLGYDTRYISHALCRTHDWHYCLAPLLDVNHTIRIFHRCIQSGRTCLSSQSAYHQRRNHGPQAGARRQEVPANVLDSIMDLGI
jgi:hypothetical protein